MRSFRKFREPACPLSRVTVRPLPGDRRKGLLVADGVVFDCALGRTGVTAMKREGDGATPLGTMRLARGYFRADRLMPPATLLHLAPVGPALGWCDAPGDRNYNRPVQLPYPASAERMMRDDGLYDICIVLDWNLRPRARGRGSAIFLHLAHPGFEPTEGCVALSLPAMRRLLPLLSPRTELHVVP